MDGYTKWVIRSRLVTTIGAVVAVAFVWIDAFRQWPYSHFVALLGWLVAIIGTLDSLGMINRKKIRKIIDEHEGKKKELLKTKNPWE